MAASGGITESLWARSADPPRFPRLEGELRADVCVVGAGIAGLTTALLLAHEGRSVVVIDDGTVGGGETARTTAHLASALDDRFGEVERLHGERGARLAYESQAAAIDTIESLARAYAPDGGFRRLDGYLFLGAGATAALLDEELEAARRAGCGAERLPRLDVGGRDLGTCIRFPRQAQIHPLRYVAGLARAITACGARLFEQAHAVDVEEARGASLVRIDGDRSVAASHVVVATNTPFHDRVTMHTKQAAYRSYVVALEAPHGALPAALYWDTEDPYHYVRLVEDGRHDVVIVGGEDHKTGQDDDPAARFTRLERWARDRLPALGAVRHRWSGQVIEPVDGVAFIGRNPGSERVYVATGDSGMGMTHGTIAGILIRDLVVGRENPWSTLYDPARKTLRAAGEWLRENLDVARAMTGLATPGDVSSVAAIAPGEGAVLRTGLSKIAVYRDAAGIVHRRSAICPHLGCVVAWNAAEKSWDCPCHGSRFDALGRVMNGPSASDLPSAD